MISRHTKKVGGYVQAIYPFDDPVALICNEEVLLKTGNQCRRIVAGQPIMGTFFLCGLNAEDFGTVSFSQC